MRGVSARRCSRFGERQCCPVFARDNVTQSQLNKWSHFCERHCCFFVSCFQCTCASSPFLSVVWLVDARIPHDVTSHLFRTLDHCFCCVILRNKTESTPWKKSSEHHECHPLDRYIHKGELRGEEGEEGEGEERGERGSGRREGWDGEETKIKRKESKEKRKTRKTRKRDLNGALPETHPKIFFFGKQNVVRNRY